MSFFSKMGWLLLIISLLTGCATTGSGLAERPDVHAFIKHVAQKDDFSEAWLNHLFNQVYLRPPVIRHTSAPRETTLDWTNYRAIFLQPKRIQLGANFWQDHAQAFNQAQANYGVPPTIIVGIIGVETEYGEVMGKYRVIDSLSTLAFNYPHRQHFFQVELEQYLLLTRELNLNPLDVYGSYAGAIGLPQFMPDSYRELAVSAIPGQSPDLWHHPNDAILSVANFFYHKGWQPNAPIAVPAQVTGSRYLDLNIEGFHPRFSVAQLRRYGIRPVTPLAPQTRVNLLILPTEHGNEYWLACHNFYVITHYNTSIFYAMAVYQLGNAIAAVHSTE